jgi:lysophospholipase L1-like esterase
MLVSSLILLPAGGSTREKPKITIFGSSVALGAAARDYHGYWYLLKERLEPTGWEVSNCSRGGDRTTLILDRFDDLLSHRPDYVFIGLSLGNEGLVGKDQPGRDAIVTQFKWGIRGLIALLRNEGIKPAVGLCYPNGYYQLEELECVKKMNLLINTWDVPSANFLGALDNGSGGWAEGHLFDPSHPNTRGQREMYYAIVPTLFDAMEAGKPLPKKVAGRGSVVLGNNDGRIGAVHFDPADTIHSWSTAFWFRTKQENDTMARVGSSFLQISDRRIGYVSEQGRLIHSGEDISDGREHHVVLSHRYAQGETLLFVDGRLLGTLPERVEPKRFALGALKGSLVYREWLVYRSALNDMEVEALYEGKLLQASLEVYAPLEDEALEIDKPVENRAQSLSEVVFTKG